MLPSAPDKQRLARAALTFLAEPGDPILGALVRATDPEQALRCIQDDAIPPGAARTVVRPGSTLRTALTAWRSRLGQIPLHADLAGYEQRGIRLLCPGDREWPPVLDDLGDTSPFALWVRGDLNLHACCAKSVAIVGSRAATGYGAHVAGEIAADLAGRGWTIISGAAYGIDAAAHRGALTVPDQGPTIAVLASGVSRPYPLGHTGLLSNISDRGLVVSDSPPHRTPTRTRFTARKRIIAALAADTVVIEAATRSGTMSAARHALSLRRQLMALPGPVTSAQSAGCHYLIRAKLATCVTDADDILSAIRSTSATWTRDTELLQDDPELPRGDDPRQK